MGDDGIEHGRDGFAGSGLQNRANGGWMLLDVGEDGGGPIVQLLARARWGLGVDMREERIGKLVEEDGELLESVIVGDEADGGRYGRKWVDGACCPGVEASDLDTAARIIDDAGPSSVAVDVDDGDGFWDGRSDGAAGLIGWASGSGLGRRDGRLRLAVGVFAGKLIAGSHGCRLEEDDGASNPVLWRCAEVCVHAL
ncbi:hypothetical protein ACLOJK_004270 [Asimina triloba]